MTEQAFIIENYVPLEEWEFGDEPEAIEFINSFLPSSHEWVRSCCEGEHGLYLVRYVEVEKGGICE